MADALMWPEWPARPSPRPPKAHLAGHTPVPGPGAPTAQPTVRRHEVAAQRERVWA